MTGAAPSHVVVLGAGAWGTALAISAASHPASPDARVTLWARDAGRLAESSEVLNRVSRESSGAADDIEKLFKRQGSEYLVFNFNKLWDLKIHFLNYLIN